MKTVLRLVVLSAAVIAIRFVLGGDSASPSLLRGLITAVALFGGYACVVRLLERRWPAELAPRPAAREFPLGLAIGSGLFAVAVGVVALLGSYHVDGTNPSRVIWPALSLAILAGVSEELLIRGVLFRILEESLGTWLALAVSAVVFGAIHLANPSATLLSGVAIALQAGVLLGLAYVATRRLWLPVAMHIAWNFTESGIFGVPLSGITVDGLLRSHLSGPSLLSGGPFGVEASLVAVLVCLAAAGVLLALARRHGRFRPPVWSARRAQLQP